VALGITAPVKSVTFPLIVAFELWPYITLARQRQPAKRKINP
jgi:hypothetical protein